MTGKGDAYKAYEVHGDSVETIRHGFEAIGMPTHRQAEAQAIVRDVLGANDVTDFRWYLPPTTPEVCCYWDGQEKNVLWVNSASVSILADDDIAQPARPLTWSKQEGAIVGWLLPAAERVGARRGPPPIAGR